MTNYMSNKNEFVKLFTYIYIYIILSNHKNYIMKY